MSFFGKLFGAKQSKKPRDVVYDFADVLAEFDHPILDESLLPHTKDELYFAFDFYLATLKALSKKGLGFADEIRKVESLRICIADFKFIDPKDKAIVLLINTGERFAAIRNAKSVDEFEKIFNKDPDACKVFNMLMERYNGR